MRPNDLDVSFGFLAPATVNLGLILSRPDTVTEYVLRILMDNKDAEKLFFIPFNTGLAFHSKFIYYNYFPSYHLTFA